MARAKRKTTRRKTQAKGRGTRRTESKGMRTGNDGLNMSTYSKFPKAVKDRFVDGYESAKSAWSSGAFKVSGELTTAKRKSARKAVFDYLRASGSERTQLYINEPNAPGKAFRKGVRSGIQVIWDEVGSGRTEYGVRFNRGRRRRNAPANVPAHVMEAAQRQGYSKRYVRRIAKLRGEGGNAPTSLSSLKRDHDGNSYWPVRTAHDTHWHYTLKDFKNGWVVEFRRRDGQSARHYISDRDTASSKKTYYRTKTKAFKALASHAFAGTYGKYKNPRRRR